jgi:tetratricopeptide (TPR) repeat protein
MACILTGCATGGGADPDYVPGAGYHLIMAEIAAQRGASATAAQEYLNSAERSADPEMSRQAAEFAFDNGFDAYALRAARRWVRLDPDDVSAHLCMARLLVRRNDISTATLEVERALGPVAARSAEDYELVWGDLGQERNAEGVTRVLTRISARSPESPALRLALGTAALQSRDFDLAIASAEKVIGGQTAALGEAEAERYADEANALIARALLARGDTEAALAHMARQVEAKSSLDLELEYVRLLGEADRHTEALARIDELEKRYATDPDVRRLRAVMSFEAGDMKTAWEVFGGLLRDGQHPDESFFHMAQIAGQQQRFDQALQLFARVQKDPYLLPAQDAISRIAEASGAPEAALKVLTDLAEFRPDLAGDLARYHAALLQRLGKDQEALEVYNEALKYRPDDADLLLGRGALLETMDRLDAALADMTAAVRLMPDNAIAMNALGYTLANRTRRHAEAYRLIRRALERDPGKAAVVDSYGWVLYRQGKLMEARSYLQLAHSLLPDPEVAAHLGEVLWVQGERDAARRLWADALEKSPESKPLKDTVARFAR